MAESSAVPAPAGARLRLTPHRDEKLARLAAAGDEHAFAAIYERYHQELYRYCRAILGSPDDAHDALQSTMAAALRALPGETRTIELRPWLYRVARNEAISLLRRRQTTVEADEAVLPHEPPAEVTAEGRERLRTLVADLASLPERQCSALVMRELSGLSHGQIADALGVSSGGARQVVYEARMALQELEDGRAMECEQVRQAISERDGRVLRARKIRAHLRGCEGCSDFRRGIEARGSELELLAPPLSAVAASGVLATVLGGSSVKAGAGLLGGLFGAGSGGAIGAKTVGVIAASAAIGVGADRIGAVDLPLPGGGERSEQAAAPGPPAEQLGGAREASRPENRAVPDPGRNDGANPAGRDRGNPLSERAKARGERGRPATPAEQGTAAAAGNSAAGGASTEAPIGTGRPESPPGAAVAADRSGGRSATPATGPPATTGQGPPAQANDAGQGPPAQANDAGQGPPAQANAGGG